MAFSHSQNNAKVRHLIVWETPATGSGAYIEMFINPSQLKISDAKIQNTTQTKGGFILQYWGEKLTEISMNGVTGVGGIEAINVLRDVYRSEQLALRDIISKKGINSKRRQSLAQLATSVVMWYGGQGFRGFFTAFNYDEEVSGQFKYQINFTAVEIIGTRKNFMPWHRKPWSTMETPSYPSNGILQGGAYGTNAKMGEMNAPTADVTTGLYNDPEFVSNTGAIPDQSKLEANFSENANPITPGKLFS